MLYVRKYGGTSLADGEKIMAAARRAAELHRQGHKILLVVSAQGQSTDEMIRRAGEINRRGSAREMDAYLSAGEQMSASLMAMALGALGQRAVSLTGYQAGIHTDGIHGNARILHIDPERILRELEGGRIVVVAGFQGLDPEGDVTTLGRGGSDTTAVALAAYLQADRCQIFTDVDGIYDRDPRIHGDARKFDRIGYEAMLGLIENGAQVLHDRSVELARDHGIRVEVLSAFSDAPGTIVGE
jgi:aspartate kinase